MQENTRKLVSVIIIICLVVISSISVSNAQTTTPTPSPTPTVTPTVTPTPTASPTPTATPTPTLTPTPSPTNSTPTPTPTPMNTTDDSDNSTYIFTPTEIYRINLPNYPLWTPVHIVVAYAFTQNYTINVQSFGLSQHKETTTPTNIAFDTTAFDSYKIHISVRYSTWVNQTVSLSLRENGTAAKIIQFDTYSKGFDIDMLVTTSAAPTFPSAGEIADNLWYRWQGVVNELEVNNQNLVDSLLSSYAINGGFAFIAFGLGIAVLLVVIWLARRQAQFDQFIHGGATT